MEVEMEIGSSDPVTRGATEKPAVFRSADDWLPRFEGVIVAMCTAFGKDGGIDFARMASFTEFLIERNVRAVLIGGSTGEFITLSAEERAKLIDRTVAMVSGRMVTIANVGHIVPGESLALAKRAVDVGINAVASILPYYHKVSQGRIGEYLRDIADGIPGTPFIVYEYPGATCNRLEVDEFRKLLDAPNVSGIKLSVDSIGEIEPFMEFMGQTAVVSGNDSLIAEFCGLGGTAVVSGNASAFPELIMEVLSAYSSGDAAKGNHLQPLLEEVIALSRGGAPDLLKWLLAQRGMDLGTARMASVSRNELREWKPPSEKLTSTSFWKV
ncbi:MAG: dihydrodipicolinate synthase family protein [Acidimicrobiales bacterium]